MPTSAQAAVYSAIRHYLRAIEAAGTDEAAAVMAKMREIPVNDFYRRQASRRRSAAARHVLRAGEDARGVKRPLGLLQDHCDDPGRSGVSPGGRGWVSAD
jgi:branched-chain amino acid transport system substrate-binding protein